MRNLSDGLATTFELLKQTVNETAVRVLTPALDSTNERIREGALKAILERRGEGGQREILARLDEMPDSWREIIRENSSRMTNTLRDAVLGNDAKLFESASRAAVWFRQYELIPAFLNLLEDGGPDRAESSGRTLLELVEELYDELAGSRSQGHRRDPQAVRRHVLDSLETSVGRFGRHKRREIIEVFLILVHRDNAVLRQVLADPHHAAYLVIVDVLTNSERGGVIRLLLSYLDDPKAPSTAISIVSKRTDAKFVGYLVKKIGREPSDAVAKSLKRMKSVAWLGDPDGLLDNFDDAALRGAVSLIMHSGIPRLKAFATIKKILLEGKPGGRREAAKALAQFPGAEANEAALKALDDSDPQVQANILRDLRQRGIPGILARLLEKVDSPYDAVRAAARSSLSEFSFDRFVASFDMLHDEARRTTGALVLKVDPRTESSLRDEMQSPIRSKRLRSIAVAEATGLTERLEDAIIELAGDEDHMVRTEAVTALGECSGDVSIRALRMALHDRSVAVQEAAKKSLKRRDRIQRQLENSFDPRR